MTAIGNEGCDDVGCLIDEINRVREEAGMEPVAYDPVLVGLAEEKTGALRKSGVLSHDGFEFSRRLSKAGLGNVAAGEVLGQGGSVASVVSQWMSDPPHREILLGDFVTVGASHDGDFWSVIFTRMETSGLTGVPIE